MTAGPSLINSASRGFLRPGEWGKARGEKLGQWPSDWPNPEPNEERDLQKRPDKQRKIETRTEPRCKKKNYYAKQNKQMQNEKNK